MKFITTLSEAQPKARFRVKSREEILRFKSIRAVHFLLVFCIIRQTKFASFALTSASVRASFSSESEQIFRLEKELLYKCNKLSEFTCQLENRCIPIEWRCDFAEQCLDGEDEFGCVPVWCNFEHDLCNWKNQFKRKMPTKRQELRRAGAGNETTSSRQQVHASLWRRYSSAFAQLAGGQERNLLMGSFLPSSQGRVSQRNPRRPSNTSRPTTSSEDPKKASSLLGTLSKMIQERLDELGGKLKQESTSRLLFSPLISSFDAFELHEEEEEGEAEKRDTHKRETLLARSAYLRAERIGQTNSMCQLRFMYSIWTGRVCSGVEGNSNSSGNNNSKRNNLSGSDVKLTLNLMARKLNSASGRDERLVVWSKTLKGVQSDAIAAQSETSAPTWSSTEVATADGHPMGWMIGVAELGHLRQIELEFSANLALVMNRPNDKEIDQPLTSYSSSAAVITSAATACSSGGSSSKVIKVTGDGNENSKSAKGGSSESSSSSSSADGRGRGMGDERGFPTEGSGTSQLAIYGSLVTFAEFSFLDCSWPQGPNRSCEVDFAQLRPKGDDSSDKDNPNLSEDDTNEDEIDTLISKGLDADGADDADIETDMGKKTSKVTRENNLTECQEGQFKCSNGICIEERKLCNYVKDCMTSRVESYANRDKLFDDEDEAQALCKSVPGREDFETHDMDLSGISPVSNNEFSAVFENQSFWTLVSNWPEHKIAIRNSLESLPHLPQHDHTLRMAAGHYLSFEIPGAKKLTRSNFLSSSSSQPHNASASNSNKLSSTTTEKSKQNLFWFYLISPWLERAAISNDNSLKASQPVQMDCRIKFFYNLVSDTSSGSSTVSESNLAPFKVYLIIEHFTMVFDRKNSSHIVGTTRKLDRFTYSHLLDHEILSGLTVHGAFIEYVGVDFWREFNYKILDIKADEKFYLRIGVLIELNDDVAIEDVVWKKSSFNIDDLATHFGCKPVAEDEFNKFEKFRDLKQNSTFNFSLSDYIKREQSVASFSAVTSTSSSRQATRNYVYAIQYEPHTLIVYVFAVLSSILGLILVIVFVIVPYVERLTISYHDQLTVGLSDIGTSPNSQVSTSELTTELDWEQVSRHWRTAAINESLLTDTVITLVDSQSQSQSQQHQLNSVESFVKLGNNDSPETSVFTLDDADRQNVSGTTSDYKEDHNTSI